MSRSQRDYHRFRSPEPPTEGGRYWHEPEDHPADEVVVYVVCGPEGCRIDRGRWVEDLDGHWTGPLPTPKEMEFSDEPVVGFFEEVRTSHDWAMMPLVDKFRVLWWFLWDRERLRRFQEGVREGRTIHSAYVNARQS